MKINAQTFLEHVGKVSLGGLINEAVFGKSFGFAVTNEEKSVISLCKEGISTYNGGEIGVFNLDLFSKAILYAKETIFAGDENLDVELIENRLIFKKDSDELKFLLSSPKVISNTIDNADEVLQKLSDGEAVIIKFTVAIRDKCLRAIQLVNPEKCEVICENGKIMFLVGKETEHNVVVDLGKVKAANKFKIVLKPDLLSKVLQSLPLDKDVILELRKNMPLLFDMEKYVFFVIPLETESLNAN